MELFLKWRKATSDSTTEFEFAVGNKKQQNSKEDNSSRLISFLTRVATIIIIGLIKWLL